MEVLDEALDDVFLGPEVVIKRRLGNAEPLGDLAQRGAFVAVFGKEFYRNLLDPRAGVAA